jgi:lipopolysaccharide transport system permease protein
MAKPAFTTSTPDLRKATTVIEPRRGWLNIDVAELWRYRNVLYILIWRDLKVRYKQTVLGFLWAFIQPLTKLIIFSAIFGRWGKMGPEGVPYPVFVFAGLLPWEFFAESLRRASQSVVGQQQFITKVYFPRLIIPVSAIGAALVDFAIAFLILFGLMLYYPEVPATPRLFAVIPLVGLTMIIAFGAGTGLAALNVAYRDVRHIVPFLIQIWLFLTPVIYAVTLVPERLRWVLALNPMTGIISGYRWAILGQSADATHLVISTVAGLILLVCGVAYFRRTERTFADIV